MVTVQLMGRKANLVTKRSLSRRKRRTGTTSRTRLEQVLTKARAEITGLVGLASAMDPEKA